MLKLRIIAVSAAIFAVIALAGCNAAKKPEVSAPAVSSIATPAASSVSADSGKVAAKIGNEKITLGEVNEMMKTVPEQYQAAAQMHKDMLLDSMINQRLLYSEASKMNFDKDPEVQKQLDGTKKEILIKAYLKKEIEDTVKVS